MKNQLSAIRSGILALLLVASFALGVSGQTETTGGLSTTEADRIIRAFTTKEQQFRHALNQYSFKRDALIQSIGMGGQIAGEFHLISTFTFDDQGNRYEKVNYGPMSTLDPGTITQEDLDDLGGINPFTRSKEDCQIHLQIRWQRENR